MNRRRILLGTAAVLAGALVGVAGIAIAPAQTAEVLTLDDLTPWEQAFIIQFRQLSPETQQLLWRLTENLLLVQRHRERLS